MTDSVISYGVDYAKTAAMRLELAIKKIQEASAMAAFVDEYHIDLIKWQDYYKAIKPLADAEDFEGAFAIDLPE